MKRVMMICLFAVAAMTANAQKFALIDMEYAPVEMARTKARKESL